MIGFGTGRLDYIEHRIAIGKSEADYNGSADGSLDE